MSVYVDDLVRHPPSKDPAARRAGEPHGHRWCHLFCDPGGEEELHAVAASIGLKRAWFQPSPPSSKPHYDLTPPRRAAAIRAGAVFLDRKGLADFFARWREHYAKQRASEAPPCAS